MSSGPPAQQTQLSYIPKTAQCRKEVEAAVSEGDPSTCLNDAEVPCQQLVPYEPVRFLPFQDNQREFVFAGKEWVIVQQWNEIGLAAVVWEAVSCSGKANRAVAITSRKHVTKHFCVAKKYCAQWQLKGSRCLTHDLCAIFIGFTQCDNCAIAIVNIIKA